VPFTLITRKILVWNRITVRFGSRIHEPVRDARLPIEGLLISASSTCGEGQLADPLRGI
jgi:hypothetical protein